MHILLTVLLIFLIVLRGRIYLNIKAIFFLVIISFIFITYVYVEVVILEGEILVMLLTTEAKRVK